MFLYKQRPDNDIYRKVMRNHHNHEKKRRFIMVKRNIFIYVLYC